jgi:RNA polymerase sigma-70 factor, ECF subfamily
VDELTRLALAAGTGDRVALEAFVRRAQPDVWRLCAHLGGRSDADDLTQEAFVRAIGALSGFRAESSARTWLLAIARRTCVDGVRRAVRRRRLQERLAWSAVPDAAEPAPAGGAEVDELVGRLDPDRRAAFVLTQVLGLPYHEAAEVCGCPVGTIRSRVARARRDLVTWLQAAERATG